MILSIENHCSVEQQHVMASHLTAIFGDSLYVEAKEGATLSSLPSPEELKGRVIVKGKKLRSAVKAQSSEEEDDLSKTGIDGETIAVNDTEGKHCTSDGKIKMKVSEQLSNGVYLSAVKFRSFDYARQTGE